MHRRVTSQVLFPKILNQVDASYAVSCASKANAGAVHPSQVRVETGMKLVTGLKH